MHVTDEITTRTEKVGQIPVTCRRWTCNRDEKMGQTQLHVEGELAIRKQIGQVQLRINGGLATRTKNWSGLLVM